MHLIIASREDEASMSIASSLLSGFDFSESSLGDGILQYNNYLFTYIEKKHLYLENFCSLYPALQDKVQDVIFLSRHSSQADIKSLTVHPTGNFSEAKLGGKEKTLSVSDPGKMSSTLRLMSEYYHGNVFSVTYEATHHGPFMNVPNFFIEIGTTSAQWEDREALDTVISSLIEERNGHSGASFVGVGGGHYMPKVTKYSVDNGVDVGHMIPKHALENIDPELISQSVEKTPGCKGFLMDRKGVKSDAKQKISDFADRNALEIIKI